MRMSLPITTDQRFISDYCAGLFTYVVPFVASQVFTVLIMVIGHLAFDGRTEGDVISYSTSKTIINFFSEAAPYLFRLVTGYLLMMLVFYAMCVLVMTCCGSILEAIMYSVLLNILVPGCIAVVLAAMCERVLGLDFEFYLEFSLPFTSPAGMLYYLIQAVDDETPMLMGFGKWVLCCVIAFVVYSIAAFLIYRHRKAEDTGKPIVYDLFYFGMMTLSVVTLMFLFMMMDEDYIIPMIIITAIFYFVAAVIRNRGFKKFGSYVTAYLITMAVSFAAYFIIQATGAFGADRYVPNAAMVDKVYTSYNGYFDQDDDIYLTSGNSLEQLMQVSNRESIQLITDVHKKVIEDKNGINHTNRFEVLYRMKSGKWVFRRYSISPELRNELIALDLTDEMREHRAEVVHRELDDIKRQNDRLRTVETYSWEHNNYYLHLTASIYNNEERDLAEYGDVFDKDMKTLPVDFTDKLYEAIRADIMEETEEEYLRPQGWCGNLIAHHIRIPLKESYRHTMEYLKALGFEKLPVIDDINTRNVFLQSIEMISVPMYEKRTGKAITAGTGDSSLRYRVRDEEFMENNRYNQEECGLFLSDYISDNLNYFDNSMLRVMQSTKNQYYADDVEYLFVINGNVYAVSPEYNETAEKLYVQQFITGLTGFEGLSDLPTKLYNKGNFRAFLDVYGSMIIQEYGQETYDMIEDIYSKL